MEIERSRLEFGFQDLRILLLKTTLNRRCSLESRLERGLLLIEGLVLEGALRGGLFFPGLH